MICKVYCNGQGEHWKKALENSHYQIVEEKESADICLQGDLSEQFTIYHNSKNLTLNIDFTSAELAHRLKHGMAKNQLFFKALGKSLEGQLVFDLTAGLGVDAFFMAHAGAQVVSVERDPLLHNLLYLSLARYLQEHKFLKQGSLRFQKKDAFHQFEELVQEFGKPKSVYIDPMFPSKKKSALPSKEMQILANILSPNQEQDLEDFLHKVQALKLGVRYILKRPLKAKAFSIEAHAQMAGKSIRYDIFNF